MSDGQPHIPDRLHPTYRDRATAMRIVLAMLNNDTDAILHTTHDTASADDVDRLILALADEFQMLAKKTLTDPIGDVERWIAFELEQADNHGQ